MKTKDFTLDSISSLISSDASFSVLADLICDMGLEIIDVTAA